MYDCKSPDCGAIFMRAWNLKRHQARAHRWNTTKFVNYMPSPSTDPVAQHTASVDTECTTWRTSNLFGGDIPPRVEWVLDESTSTITETDSDQLSPLSGTVPAAFTGSGALSAATVPNVDLTQALSCTKRKRSLPPTDRVLRAQFAPPIPQYQVKRSRIEAGQQKAIAWLGTPAKTDYDRVYANFVGWFGGVNPSHRGTCVLCPEDLRAVDPASLVDLVDPRRLPAGNSPRLTYRYSDHTTDFARATGWFNGPWPRTGVQLDNLIGCGPFEPMDASHLCHQEHCLVHLTYEAAHINQDRKQCAAGARSARRAGTEVAARCSRHNPPCLLQLAALATSEVYLIQFDILRKATGLRFQLRAHDGPHPYPTFETRLPLTFATSSSEVHVRPADLVVAAPSAEKPARPDLVCLFCDRFKAFASPTGYWAHLFHKHGKVDCTDRLEEVRRTADLWAEYWRQGPDGGKHQSTKQKISIARKDTFC